MAWDAPVVAWTAGAGICTVGIGGSVGTVATGATGAAAEAGPGVVDPEAAGPAVACSMPMAASAWASSCRARSSSEAAEAAAPAADTCTVAEP